MTGFGKATGSYQAKKITVEIKTLNSKTADIFVRMSGAYREKELELRSLLAQTLERGKIECAIYIDQALPTTSLNTALFKQYFVELQALATELGAPLQDVFLISSRMPNILNTDKEELDVEEWQFVLELVQKALADILRFRAQEGAVLAKVLAEYVQNIEKKAQQIPPFETQRLQQVKEKMHKTLEELSEKAQKADPFRLEQEILYHIERLDITEEKTRLHTHCQYFLNTLQKQEQPGKKLGFIAQEIGREINTIGSKANHFDIQKLVIEMKEELEKIKEQLLNLL